MADIGILSQTMNKKSIGQSEKQRLHQCSGVHCDKLGGLKLILIYYYLIWAKSVWSGTGLISGPAKCWVKI